MLLKYEQITIRTTFPSDKFCKKGDSLRLVTSLPLYPTHIHPFPHPCRSFCLVSLAHHVIAPYVMCKFT